MQKRVDNIPLGLKIFYLPFSYLVGAFHWLSIVLLHLSCRVEIKGRENLEMAPHHILCLWHFAWWPCFVSFGRVPYRTMLNHPLRYMKPLHVMPILPVRFSISRYVVLPSWDKKQVPLPFSKITVEYSKPIKVKDEEFDEISSLLASQL
jgi:lysophospholipid acyltransferase (LPLAT)-like uncharacterized protein